MLSVDTIRTSMKVAALPEAVESPVGSTFHERVLAYAVHELTEALEDAVTGCSNPRQPPGDVLAKYKEALDE